MRPRDLKLPCPDPRPHDLNTNHDLDACHPYVLDGEARKVALKVNINADEVIEYTPIGALFNVVRQLDSCADWDASKGVNLITARDPDSLQVQSLFEIDFSAVPVHVVYIVIGLVTPRTFSVASNVEVQLLHRTADDEWTGSMRRRQSALGIRRCTGLFGKAFCLQIFVRRGCWWHLHSRRDEVPGCSTKDEVLNTWQRSMRKFLKQDPFVAQMPVRKRVVFRVLAAHDLAAMDRNLFKKNSSDPYLIVTCGNDRQEYPVQKATLDPTWDDPTPHTLPNVLASDPRDIRVFMYDKDKFKADDFMGQCSIPVAALWNLDGIHQFNFLLTCVPQDELQQMKETNKGEYKRHKSKADVKGYITVEAHVAEEPLPREVEELLKRRTVTAEL